MMIKPTKKPQGGMSVREAGRKGGQTVKARYGSEFYESIGRKGGESSHNGVQRTRNIGMPNRENGGAANGHNGDPSNDKPQRSEVNVSFHDGENGMMKNESGDQQNEPTQYGHRDD